MKISYETKPGVGQILVERTLRNVSDDHRLWMEVVIGPRKGERLLVPLTVAEARELALELQHVAADAAALAEG